MGMTEAVQSLLESKGSTLLKSGISLAELIRRPELSYEDVAPIDKNRPELAWDVQEQVNINIKYDGYIRRQMKQVEQFKKLEAKKIPEDLDYEKVKSLRIEARQKAGTVQTCFHWTGITNFRCFTGGYLRSAGLYGAVWEGAPLERV